MRGTKTTLLGLRSQKTACEKSGLDFDSQETLDSFEKLAEGEEVTRASCSGESLVVIAENVILPKNHDKINVFDLRGKIIGSARFLWGVKKLDVLARHYPDGKYQDFHKPVVISFYTASGEFEITLKKGKSLCHVFSIGSRGTCGYGFLI